MSYISYLCLVQIHFGSSLMLVHRISIIYSRHLMFINIWISPCISSIGLMSINTFSIFFTWWYSTTQHEVGAEAKGHKIKWFLTLEQAGNTRKPIGDSDGSFARWRGLAANDYDSFKTGKTTRIWKSERKREGKRAPNMLTSLPKPVTWLWHRRGGEEGVRQRGGELSTVRGLGLEKWKKGRALAGEEAL